MSDIVRLISISRSSMRIKVLRPKASKGCFQIFGNSYLVASERVTFEYGLQDMPVNVSKTFHFQLALFKKPRIDAVEIRLTPKLETNNIEEQLFEVHLDDTKVHSWKVKGAELFETMTISFNATVFDAVNADLQLVTTESLPRLGEGHKRSEFRALEVVHTSSLAHHDGVYESTSNDPQLWLQFEKRIFENASPATSALISITIDQVAEHAHNVRVYVDYGSGMTEQTAVNPRLLEDGVYRLIVPMPSLVKSIRLDPSDKNDFRGKISVRARLISVADIIARDFRDGECGSVTEISEMDTIVSALSGGDAANQLVGEALIDGLKYINEARGTLTWQAGPEVSISYDRWIERVESVELALYAERLKAIDSNVTITILMTLYKPPMDLLREAIESALSQSYANIELCIVDDGSKDVILVEYLNGLVTSDRRVKVSIESENVHIPAALNKAMKMAGGQWVCVLDQDDLLAVGALAAVVCAISDNPNAKLIYTDEDKYVGGRRTDPFFKPDFSPELLYGQNYFNHLSVYEVATLRKIGGWRVGFEGSQDYDLNLRMVRRIKSDEIIHIPSVCYHWRAIVGSTALAVSEKNYAYVSGQKALEDHIARLNIPASVVAIDKSPYYRIKGNYDSNVCTVSIIIPTRDHLDVLSMCVSSILKFTRHKNYKVIIVDNGSVEPETIAYFKEIITDRRVSVISYNEPFNYSAINNFAVSKVDSDFVCLLNNDIEVIEQDWLSELVFWAGLEGVGCVGAKLLYPDRTIQHAGVVLGIGGVAGHSHKHFGNDADGYFSRLKVVSNFSAVTGACLLVKRRLYVEAGGLEEEGLAVAFNDIDFCIKVRALGYRNVFTPFAKLIHHESRSRGFEDSPEKVARFNREADFMVNKWTTALSSDPYYSANLSLDDEAFSISDRRHERLKAKLADLSKSSRLLKNVRSQAAWVAASPFPDD